MRFLHHEASSASLQGYVHQGTQLEQIWQQAEEKVTELTLQGLTPWEAYSTMGLALAFVRACRLNVVLVQKLLEGLIRKTLALFLGRPMTRRRRLVNSSSHAWKRPSRRLILVMYPGIEFPFGFGARPMRADRQRSISWG